MSARSIIPRWGWPPRPRSSRAALPPPRRAEGSDLTPEQRIHLAEYLTSRRYTAEALPEAAFCGGPAWTGPDPADASWMGFAGNLAGTGFQSLERTGLDASDVPNLELRWAFAFPDGTNMRTSPAVAGDVAVVAGPFGEVAALDLATGCVRWSYEAYAPNSDRSAVVVDVNPERQLSPGLYALDLMTGEVVWSATPPG